MPVTVCVPIKSNDADQHFDLKYSIDGQKWFRGKSISKEEMPSIDVCVSLIRS